MDEELVGPGLRCVITADDIIDVRDGGGNEEGENESWRVC